MCIYIYTYLYTYMYTYIPTYIYIYTHIVVYIRGFPEVGVSQWLVYFMENKMDDNLG